MQRPEIVEEFIRMYETLNKDNLGQLPSIYSEDVLFIDALHEVSGLNELEKYFSSMYENLLSSSVKVTDVQCTPHRNGTGDEGSAYLTWVMQYQHPKLAGGKLISLEGVTHILFTDRVTYHRDYADMGQMLYEHIPVLGAVIRQIKRRATQ